MYLLQDERRGDALPRLENLMWVSRGLQCNSKRVDGFYEPSSFKLQDMKPERRLQ
jgi:hypothetical protein